MLPLIFLKLIRSLLIFPIPDVYPCFIDLLSHLTDLLLISETVISLVPIKQPRLRLRGCRLMARPPIITD